MTPEEFKAQIARTYGTPSAGDRPRHRRAQHRPHAGALRCRGRRQPPAHQDAQEPRARQAAAATAGARGITCQKLGEAEVMADGGLDDILISYNLLGEEKMGRLGALLRQRNVTVAADNPTTVAGLPQRGRRSPGGPARSWWSATPAASAPASRRRREAIALARDIAAPAGPAASPGFMFYPPEDAHGPRRRPSSTRRWPASARTGSMPRSSPPAARPTSPISASSRAPPSTAPAPTSSTTA